MEKVNNIVNGQIGIKVGLQPGIKLPYSVPAFYFDQLLTSIFNSLLATEKLVAKKPQPNFAMPDGYFNHLAETIAMSVITASPKSETQEELASIAPFLSTLSRQYPYQVPDNYFENLTIHEVIIAPVVGKIIPISRARYWAKLAAAASVACIVAAGALLFSGKNGSQTDVLAYKTTDATIKSNINNLSDDELTKYLNNDYLAYNADMVIIDDGGAAPDLEQKVEAVPDEDLDQYLQDAATSAPIIKKGI
ncbi:hypothetical protein [Parasediminibacterium sp. JCM 36343]|uniref:hypothetical protein n=1 Tax=Parasediminibacterium sp. JCM 36343 TaxID=3374279 RepID=UPI00397BA2C4